MAIKKRKVETFKDGVNEAEKAFKDELDWRVPIDSEAKRNMKELIGKVAKDLRRRYKKTQS